MPTIDLTVARPRDVAGVRRRTIGQYTGPASYATGGDPFVAGDAGLGEIEKMIFAIARNVAGTAIRFVTYDHTNGKAMWFTDSSTEVAATTDLSTFRVRFEAVGR